MRNQVYAVSATFLVEAATAQEAAETARLKLANVQPARYDVKGAGDYTLYVELTSFSKRRIGNATLRHSTID